MSELRIGSLDEFLLSMMEGRPRAPRRYELRCHPDVYLALQRAATESAPWPPREPGPGLYGSADVVVRPDLGSGGWELFEDGKLLKSGRLGEDAKDGPHPLPDAARRAVMLLLMLRDKPAHHR